MNRTLAGHLEDLDLDEVVRVIALSRRSGVLSVESPEGDAEVLFLLGRVVSARMGDSNDTVADVLVRAGILTPSDLPAVGRRDTPTLDDILRETAARRPDDASLVARADAVLIEHLRSTVLRVLLFHSGHFSFRITEAEAPPPRYPRDTGYTVAEGVDADEIAREARRRRLGRRKDPLAQMSQGSARGKGAADDAADLVVVADDAAFLDRVERQASLLGLSLRPLLHARAALEQLSHLESGPAGRLMVVDLVMPRSTGRGLLGGLEVLRRANELGCADRVYLAVADPHDDAAARVKELGGAGVVRKPVHKSGAPGSLAPFLNPVLAHLGRPALVDEPVDLVEQLRSELIEFEEEWRADQTRADDPVKSLEVLKSLLGELNDPSFEEEIPLLVLRFASAFFSRGALFHVHSMTGTIVGLGGYGIGPGDAGRTIHSVRLPLEADTVFLRCLRERCGVRQPFYDSEWNNRLLYALGGPRPREVYTAPLASPRGIEAVIYADNAIDGRPFPDIALLEIFLQQAGAALERWSLKRQVEELSGRA